MNKQQQREAISAGQPVLEGPEPVRMIPINPHTPGGRRMPSLLIEMMAGLLQAGVEFNVAASTEFPAYEGRYVAMLTWGELIGTELEGK